MNATPRTRPPRLRRAAVAMAAVAALAGSPLTVPAAARAQVSPSSQPACPAAEAGTADCLLRVITTDDGRPMRPTDVRPTDFPAYTPADLQAAYNLPSDWLGGGMTVAVVAPLGYPAAETDLAAYRTGNGLAPCTTDYACFRKINQRGGDTPPPASTAWSLNAATALDMASATCPNCRLLLVEADSARFADLGAAVDQAVAQGAHAVVTPFGGPEYDGQRADAEHYDHPGTAIVAPAGSNGFGGGSTGTQPIPAAYPSVIAVGGTTLYPDDTARGWSERAWERAGSGCSITEARPAWQGKGSCGNRRTVADVAAVASTDSPVIVFNSDRGGSLLTAGTPVAAGIIGGVYGLAGHTLPASPGARLYKSGKYLNDVTAGTNGSCLGGYLCTAGRGYDGPTGLGTPNGIAAF
ncbi:S53 family peptidase [Spirillospora sp. NBC_01491]|uniref:S53 family peptidase n=1 Tax=Spirillospora sp. NBC_01491 TaxID=2976007 RepID=UPI002E377A5C|nr:hypothetical protein [Spirillospora sp. NBC_01491]